MDYNTALALKNAGFKQGNWGKYYSENKVLGGIPLKLNEDGSIEVSVIDSHLHDGMVPDGDDVAYVPTLSELIDQMQSRYKYIDGLINDAHFILVKTFIDGGKVGYIAYLDGDWESSEIENKYRFISENASVAVSSLWLALNHKKDL